jgi:hypothetical protein
VLGGDGSIEEGSFYESLLMMKSLNLSAIVLIEDNEWSLGTRISERRCPIDVRKVCEATSTPHVKLSGNDPYLYIEELKRVRIQALQEHTPICVEASLTTLGDWIMTNPENANGKFINYHAGGTPGIDIKSWPIAISQSAADPIFVLRSYFSLEDLSDMATAAMNNIDHEI